MTWPLQRTRLHVTGAGCLAARWVVPARSRWGCAVRGAKRTEVLEHVLKTEVCDQRGVAPSKATACMHRTHRCRRGRFYRGPMASIHRCGRRPLLASRRGVGRRRGVAGQASPRAGSHACARARLPLIGGPSCEGSSCIQAAFAWGQASGHRLSSTWGLVPPGLVDRPGTRPPHRHPRRAVRYEPGRPPGLGLQGLQGAIYYSRPRFRVWGTRRPPLTNRI